MRNKRALVFLAFCFLSGCAPVMWIYHGITGPDFRLSEINPIVGTLDEYQRVEIEPFTNQVPHLAPEPVLTRIAPEIASLLQEEKLFAEAIALPQPSKEPAAVPTLVVSGIVIDYDPGDSNDRVFCLGGEAYLTARVKLTDKRSGKVIGTANVGGIVKTTFNRPEDTPLGVAKAVVEWMKANHSPVEK